jgi:hypothetical protein
MSQRTFSTDIGTSPIEPVNILAILPRVELLSQICLGFHEPANYMGSYTTGSKEITDTDENRDLPSSEIPKNYYFLFNYE